MPQLCAICRFAYRLCADFRSTVIEAGIDVAAATFLVIQQA
jgi:hypothetical protein